MWTIDLSTAKPLLHFTLHVLADLMSAATEDQVTKTKLILYQSISDVVQITINIFPVYIHYPGKNKVVGRFFKHNTIPWGRKVKF